METTIQPYDPDWKLHFEQIRKSLEVVLGNIEGIVYEHIGSTAVPGLSAQPIIDVLVTVPDPHLAADTQSKVTVEVEQVCTDLTTTRRYEEAPQFDRGLHFSLKARDESSHHHMVFVCARDSPLARAHLATRDTLREDAELRDRYATNKTRALEAAKGALFEKERCLSAYSEAKIPHLQEVIVASGQFKPMELAVILAAPPTARWDAVCTQRLLLREYELSDIGGMFALEGNEENARYQDWPPWTYVQARQNILRGIRDSYSKDRTVVELAVVHEGAFIGRIGGRVTIQTVAVSPSLPKEPVDTGGDLDVRLAEHIDLWYSFLPSSQGKGLATEAMTAFIAVLVQKEKTNDQLLELEIECDPRNTGSWKMAERLGFEKFSLTERAWESKGEWVDSLVYRKIV